MIPIVLQKQLSRAKKNRIKQIDEVVNLGLLCIDPLVSS